MPTENSRFRHEVICVEKASSLVDNDRGHVRTTVRSKTEASGWATAMAETQGFEPWIRFRAYDDLANRCLQPLGHVSPNQWASAPYRGRTSAMQDATGECTGVMTTIAGSRRKVVLVS